MPKETNKYFCTDCGAEYFKWHGHCENCNNWNTIKVAPYRSETVRHNSVDMNIAALPPIKLKDVKVIDVKKFKTGFSEFDYVLGGGVVPGSVILLGGDPGIGKSTILLQVLSKLSINHSVIYVSGEESLSQIALRTNSLFIDHNELKVLAQSNLDTIFESLPGDVEIVAIDSIQTMTPGSFGVQGGVAVVKEACARLVKYAKQNNIVVFIVGHVTKDGVIAGPRMLEHMVDVVLYFQSNKDDRYRVIRAVKNRFGSINEIAVFDMTDKGLIEVKNPSSIFLSHKSDTSFGSSIMISCQGSRPMLLELQSLVDESFLEIPRRIAIGVENNRLAMLLALLNKYCRISTHRKDVFINLVGGIKLSETSSDLPIILSVLSSIKCIPISKDTAVFGEIGLSGEVRPVTNGAQRVKEAAKYGIKKIIAPSKNRLPKIVGLEIILVSNVSELLNLIGTI